MKPKEIKKRVQLPALPKEHEYLSEVISDAVWLIASEVENEEDAQPNSTMPREIRIVINLAEHTDMLPVLVSSAVGFGKPYGQVESEYIGDPWLMGMPSWYDRDSGEEIPIVETEKIWESPEK
ncbi:MAG: hypothetical protein HYS26_00635 [Candidatus Kaiserbacteria bacterium]|nr:MAG: hypothetical protein HYS26_00635 [Candidatus Kaiserbacteria bacterium]